MRDAYYQKQLLLAQVDEHDTVIGQVERWKAHQEGILHRGFTAILSYQGQYILQHRKHPAFDKYWDFSFSSHQLVVNGTLQADIEAINSALNREWNITPADLFSAPVMKGKVYYKAKDPNSIYTEHEFDYIYQANLKRLPTTNPDVAYGYELCPSPDQLTSSSYLMAPWVVEIINQLGSSLTL